MYSEQFLSLTSNAVEVVLHEICSVHEMLLKCPYEGDWDDWARRTNGRGDKCTQNFSPKRLNKETIWWT
jgi:hypothetical protein